MNDRVGQVACNTLEHRDSSSQSGGQTPDWHKDLFPPPPGKSIGQNPADAQTNRQPSELVNQNQPSNRIAWGEDDNLKKQYPRYSNSDNQSNSHSSTDSTPANERLNGSRSEQNQQARSSNYDSEQSLGSSGYSAQRLPRDSSRESSQGFSSRDSSVENSRESRLSNQNNSQDRYSNSNFNDNREYSAHQQGDRVNRFSREPAQDIAYAQYPEMTRNNAVDNSLARAYTDATTHTWRGFPAMVQAGGSQYIDGFYATKYNNNGQMSSEFHANDGRLFRVNGMTMQQMDGENREPVGAPFGIQNLAPTNSFKMNSSASGSDSLRTPNQVYYQDILKSSKELANQLNSSQLHNMHDNQTQTQEHTHMSQDNKNNNYTSEKTPTSNNAHEVADKGHNVKDAQSGTMTGHHAGNDMRNWQDRVKDIQTKGGEIAQSAKPNVGGGGGGGVAKPFDQPILFPNPTAIRSEGKGTRGVGGGSDNRLAGLKLIAGKLDNSNKMVNSNKPDFVNKVDQGKISQIKDNANTPATDKRPQGEGLRIDIRILQKQLENDVQSRQQLLKLLIQGQQGKLAIPPGVNSKLGTIILGLNKGQVKILQGFLESFDTKGQPLEMHQLTASLQLQLGHMLGYIKYAPDKLPGYQLSEISKLAANKFLEEKMTDKAVRGDSMIDKNLASKNAIDPKVLVSRPVAFTGTLNQLSPELRKLLLQLQERKQNLNSQSAHLQQRAKYRIKIGDTLELIAQKQFGNEKIAKLIFQINQKVFLQRVIDGVKYAICVPGDEIWLPTHYEVIKSFGNNQQLTPVDIKFGTPPELSAQAELEAKFGNIW